jgi:hypothetical protein
MIYCNKIANVEIHISWRANVFQKVEVGMIRGMRPFTSEGMDRGREIATDALKGKVDQIWELDDRIERFKKEVEMSRAVLAALKVRNQ